MEWIALLCWLLLCYAMAAIGGWWAAGELADWYLALAKPAIAPPNWVFGPVWTVLYTLMAIAAWQVWLLPASPVRTRALLLFFVQLVLNLIWSWIFFREHDISNALADAILLWIAIGTTTIVFYQLKPVAAWLMLPYWAWASFATLLNAAIWRLNPQSR